MSLPIPVAIERRDDGILIEWDAEHRALYPARELRLACPEGYEPAHAIFQMHQHNTRLVITEDPDEAAAFLNGTTTGPPE